MNRALLLDRDGVINIDHGYTSQSDNFEFVPGIFELVRRAKAADFKVIVVTNQSGIGRGYYSEDDFHRLTLWMKDVFAQHHATIDAVYFCPHHPTHANDKYLQQCGCRKPNPGMLLKARKEFALDMADSVMVGDKPSDMRAAEIAGVGRRILFSENQDAEGVEKVSLLDQIRFTD